MDIQKPMIKFFRNIRRNLLSEGKTSRYIKYAVGEIVLVVIGILIALQINNWNQKQQDKMLEQATLKALLSEFQDNYVSVNDYLENIKKMLKFGDTLMKLIGPEITSTSKYDVHRLIGEVSGTMKCIVSVDVLEDVQSSGRLNLLSNEQVRRAISKWSSQLKELQSEEFDWAQEFSSQYIPFTHKWLQWENVDYILNNNDSIRYTGSRFNVDPRLMLQQPEFENIMNEQYWRFTRIKERTKVLLRKTDTLIGLLKKELN